MPRKRRGKGAAASGSGEQIMLQKKSAAAASSGGAPAMDSGNMPFGSDSSGEVQQKNRGVPAMDSGERSFGSDSSGEKKAATAAWIQGAPAMDSGKRPSGSDSSGEMAWSEGARAMDPEKGLSCSDSSGGMLQKKAAAVASSQGSLDALNENTSAEDREESDSKHRTKKPRTVLSAMIPHGHCTEDEGDMDLSGGMLGKQSPKVEAVTSVSGGMPHEHLAEEADTAKGIQESDSNEIVHVKKEDTLAQEVEDLVKEMDASCIGEPISSDEFLGYYHRLPCNPDGIDLDHKLEDKDICDKEVLHALYRLRYLKYQFKYQMSKGDPLDDKLKSLLDKSEDDCNQEFLEKEEFFTRFEKEMTLDWFFHPDYKYCSSLTDYQRLVLKNYGGTEYIRWSEYHEYLHSYKTEKEYLKYCAELSEKLKWMEDYFGIYCPSLKWDYITSRGAFQAIKIAATNFSEITLSLAYNGYYEFQESMSYDATWFKEYDDVYFEIWQRVTQNSLGFKEALSEVCKLNRFPLRQGRMEGALESAYTMMRMETEYQTCTEAITSEDKEDKAKARKLIAEAVKTRVNKPKSYEQYIRKKIDIARIIGILPQED